MKKYLLLLSIFSYTIISAQNPDDALRTAWFTQNGTARTMAIGGALGSLGGDITSANINPAGLGLYKTSEFILSPGFALNNNKFNYRGTDTTNNKNKFNYGPIGFVFGHSNSRKSEFSSSAFAISVNQLANYNNRIQFKGFNNQSSFTEQYLEELVRDRADTFAALDNYIFGSSLAFRTFLIDTLRGNSGEVLGYKTLVDSALRHGGINQDYISSSRGGYHEIALGLAGSLQDKVYLGGSLTIPVSYYERTLTYSETDATANPNNNFESFTFQEKTKSFGIGLGLKLGAIFKPTDAWRLGFAFHTPQLMTFTDNIRSSLVANTEGYAHTRSESSDNLNDGNAGERKYNIVTPYRAIASASFVIEDKTGDTKKQRGFLSADIEFVNYRGARYSQVNEEDDDEAMRSYLKMTNAAIKDYYKGNFNFRLGGELKFNTIMVRLGGAYYGSPYSDEQLKASRTVASGGLGYRNKGMFIDLTYSHTFVKDVVFPYRLNDKANTYAEQTGSRGNVVMTLGFKF